MIFIQLVYLPVYQASFDRQKCSGTPCGCQVPNYHMKLDGLLWQTREPGEIGLALLQEGISPLLTLFSHVIEHCCITSQLLNTRQAIGISIESSFEEAQSKWAFLQYLLCPLYCLFFQAFQRHYGVYQSHFQRLLGRVLPAEIPDLTGFFVTDDTCHIRGSPACIKTANFGTSLSEPSIVSGDGQIA